MKLKQIQTLENAHLFSTYSRKPLLIARGKGAWVYDDEGRRYLDFVGGLGVNALGHCHSDVVRAVKSQVGTLAHVSNLFYSEPCALLARELSVISKMPRAFFANSGTEANEAAIKLARLVGNSGGRRPRNEIITLSGAFHGKTLATLAATGNPQYSAGFGPLDPDFVQVEFDNVKSLKRAVSPRTCAVLFEPIQGESGVFEMSGEMAEALASAQKRRGILLIADEVQCGLGRTGKWFAHQRLGLKPDIMTIAKPLGGGLPMSAMLARGRAAEAFQAGQHSSTFGGGPVVSRAALAFLKAVKQNNLLANAASMGKLLVRGLNDIRKRIGVVTEVRGAGLMIGIGVNRSSDQIALGMMEKGVLVNSVRNQTVRILPPFIVTEKEAALFLKKFEICLKELDRREK